MFKLSGRILDWVDENPGITKISSSPFAIADYALVLEDYEGKIGRKYPLASKEDVENSIESFEKYASRLMPLHRRTAATFLDAACSKYALAPTEKVAMYSDSSITNRMVPYRKALADYEPIKIAKDASSIIQSISNIASEENLDFGVEDSFVKQAAYELSYILKENEICTKKDALVQSIQKIATDGVPLPAKELYEIARHVCSLASVDINKTALYNPHKWPKALIKKEASADVLDEFVLDNIKKLEGHFNTELIEKISTSPTKVLSALPEEISKIVADLLTSNE
jgi:hypothetical protein